ncbi:hypothetical protein HPB50_019018 [Hyalomma asiaticum]|uniref:Uncharacterized protein n=1 Tax=Hyalomma asiaticum TaxID=266040 RepID=A0ACB7T5F4_HYAAI|nr:hypothetical protein HPB50_019018 [Hyalomma asiaticum]
MRSLWRTEYNAALARFPRRIRDARDSFERECHLACSRGNVFAEMYGEAFGRTRPPRLLPVLEKSDGSLTSTSLETGALLLQPQITVDRTDDDLLEHVAVRSLAGEPYGPSREDVPFTEAEVRAVIAGMPPRWSAGPDEITPRLMKGIFEVHTRSLMSMRLCGWVIFLSAGAEVE